MSVSPISDVHALIISQLHGAYSSSCGSVHLKQGPVPHQQGKVVCRSSRDGRAHSKTAQYKWKKIGIISASKPPHDPSRHSAQPIINSSQHTQPAKPSLAIKRWGPLSTQAPGRAWGQGMVPLPSWHADHLRRPARRRRALRS